MVVGRGQFTHPGAIVVTRSDLHSLSLPSAKQGGATYRYILKEMDVGRLIIPDYQRGRVWTDEQSALFVGFVLTGGQPPPIWIQEHPDSETEEIVDGLQRLSAMRLFMEGAIPAELPNSQRVWRKDLDGDCDGMLKGLYLTKMIVCLPTRADVLRLYLRLNRGGTVHTEAEINRVNELLAREVTV